MSPSVKNQASIVAGRRQEEHPKPTTPYPDPRGAMETPLNTPGGSGSLAPQTRENAQDEIDKSRPHRVSALKQAWRFFSGRYRALQPSPYPEDRRGKATRLDESQIQSYWNTPFQPERQAPPASHSTRQSFANDHEPEDIEIVAWNPGPRRSVHIVHDDPRQAVRSQVALVVDPSTEDFSSGSDSESSVTSACDSCSVPTTHSQDETYGEDEEEDIVMQARRATRVGRATLVTFPELNRNQNEDVQERRPPSVDLADCSVKWDDAQRLA
ncbi:unnamed protein product [Fusarium venenatum]|uniref:Uncharacterized protein n=1 Tax=Fusarium venenatum TaxID=56646 RepID=A0A2L2TFR4_9HYPO|nr:uncharacterized protein FVRRES_00783 [Fusarium venenatum]CEI64271.1 unnamed protein product [Fusarium venenatum]